MRGLDTNVLVRYLAADDPAQFAAADRVVEECRKRQEPLFLPAPVLCELVWVLARTYKQTKAAIVPLLEHILDEQLFRIEHDAAVRRSLRAYRDGKASFADYLIGEISREAGCRDTVTFDGALRGTGGFTVLS